MISFGRARPVDRMCGDKRVSARGSAGAGAVHNQHWSRRASSTASRCFGIEALTIIRTNSSPLGARGHILRSAGRFHALRHRGAWRCSSFDRLWNS